MIYGDRVKQVRELLGWTQVELARQLGVSQPFVAQIEGGKEKVPDVLLEALIFRTSFPAPFFETPPTAEFPLGSLLFRARASMTEREEKTLRVHASLAHEVLYRILARAGRPLRDRPVRIPHVPSSPEYAATVARSELGIAPDGPVPHVIHAMESAGALVLGLPRAFVGGDAFCVWTLSPDGTRSPVVVLSADRPADRVRMSASHELGHLVMHQPLPANTDVHQEADRFAGAFLMPADSFRADVPASTTLDTFLQIKMKWGVSVQAAIVRANHLGLITERKYRTLFQALSAKGWRKQEPLSNRVPLERPRAFRQIVEIVYGKQLDYRKIAEDISYPEPFVRDLLEAHAGRDVTPASASKPSVPGRQPLQFRPKGH